MMTENSTTTALQVTKLLSAEIETVWDAWEDPAKLAHWWAPNGFSTTIHKMELKEGEEWLLTLHGPDGKNYPNKSIFGEIIPRRKIVYQHFYPKFLGTVLFTPRGNDTLLDWTLAFETPELFDVVVKTFKADEGLKQNVEKLEKFLAGGTIA